MKNEQHMLDLAVWVLAGMKGEEGKGEGKGGREGGERVHLPASFWLFFMVTG